ncbi:hypothetical protein Pmi06nite_75890 [Planotetraspora mira]|uniref:DNA (cytosine-5-)-methyltransferase n=1 Tax=Planotetraspora mira TaxID=58121 RepID=A0A8J3XAL2_9ACTN|nr:hypothetical protein Pmi06nite_75890 [Planotetraspora mira]
MGETLRDLMAENGWEGVDDWVKKANDIAPTIVGGSKKHGGADLGPTRAKRAWAALGVDAYGVHDTAPPYSDKRPMTEYGPKLTCEMVARLQGWDHKEYKWTFTGPKTSRYRQIGNAFPPPVAKALGLAIGAALRHEGEKRQLETDRAHDLVYRALRAAGDFMTVEQIMAKADIQLTDPEIERRITLLSRDFEIAKVEQSTGDLAYKLVEFKAFVGQNDHLRHEYVRTKPQTIS